MVVDGIRVVVENGPVSQEEIAHYIDHLRKEYKNLRLCQLTLRRGDGYVNLRYSFEGNPLQRVWRFDACSNGHGFGSGTQQEEGAV